MYKIKYLPIAQMDLRKVVEYISDNLKSPKAARDLVDALDKSISKLVDFPYSFKAYQSIQTFEDEYRVLPVKNYLVFYIVKGKIVEIHRIIYKKSDIKRIIK